MKKERIAFSFKELKILPIGFQFFKYKSFETKLDITSENKPKVIEIKDYQTNMYQSTKFYKPISKIKR